MAYRRPAVTVIQEFIGLVPALAAFSLPSCSIGAAYQIVNDDSLGSYGATLTTYAYASLMGGAQVDLLDLDPSDPFPITKLPISAYLKNAKLEIVAAAATGSGSLQAFSDLTTNKFQKALAGDLVKIVPALAVVIIAAQTNGASVQTAGLLDRLTAGSSGQFANVKAGDTVVITAGTKALTGTYTVLVKISNDVLKLSAAINDGTGVSSNTAYSIAGDRGVNNAGNYRIKTITDVNNVVLESPLAEAEAPISYSVDREASRIDLAKRSSAGDGFFPEASGITLGATLTHMIGSDTFNVISGGLFSSYRALRNDLAADVVEYANLAAVQAVFGADQIVPANPLAFGLSIMLQNTVTPVNGLGLDGHAVSDETLSFLNALDVLATTNMYALVPLTQNPAVHQEFKTHVDGFSAAAKRKERVAIINRLVKTEETLVDESTTVTTLSGSRIIANTQVDGAGVIGFPSTVNDASSNAFLGVQRGDSLVVVGGTNANTGTFPVASITSMNALIVTGAIFTGTCTNLEYYIVRKDGLSADGLTFYDRNASFISSGVAPGQYLQIDSGALAGRYLIGSIASELQLALGAAVPGVTSLETAIDYEVNRNMTKSEQAAFVAGYSSGFSDRRVVNVWPDSLDAPVGQSVEPVPGFYGGCAIGAITTGLPTQQGFTNLSISGFLGLQHSSKYFNDDQLDAIADGGTMILAQDGDSQPLYVRHQLTTDRSAIKFQEFSVTKNVDFISKFVRDAFKGFPGRYNIVDTTLDELRGVSKAVITFLKDDTRLPRIGGVIKAGTLSQIAASETQIDSVKMRFRFDIPIPLNNLDITLEV